VRWLPTCLLATSYLRRLLLLLPADDADSVQLPAVALRPLSCSHVLTQFCCLCLLCWAAHAAAADLHAPLCFFCPQLLAQLCCCCDWWPAAAAGVHAVPTATPPLRLLCCPQVLTKFCCFGNSMNQAKEARFVEQVRLLCACWACDLLAGHAVAWWVRQAVASCCPASRSSSGPLSNPVAIPL
jgi:hypothetical protein